MTAVTAAMVAARANTFGSAMPVLLSSQTSHGPSLGRLCSRLDTDVFIRLWPPADLPAGLPPKRYLRFVELLACVGWLSQEAAVQAICHVIIACIRLSPAFAPDWLVPSVLAPVLQAATITRNTLLEAAVLAVAAEMPGIDLQKLQNYL